MQDGQTMTPVALPEREIANGKPSHGHLRAILALILREMGSRYGRNPGGYVWAVVEPLGMIFILSLGFSLLLRSPPLGTSFLLFYATGYLPYSLFQKNTRMIMMTLAQVRSLLYYPAVGWFDAVAARFILSILTEALVAYLLLFGILMVVDTKTVLDFGPILLSFILAALLGTGMGMLNCVFVGFVPVWQTIWGIITRPMLLASGVLYIYEDLPRAAQEILWYFPLLHLTAISREGYYPIYEADFASVWYVTAVGMVLLVMGLLLMRRYHLDILARR